MTGLLVSLGAVALATLLAAASPGPNMIAVISATVASGRTAGILTGIGIVTGALIWSVAALAGLSSLFEYFPNIALALRIVGALYLVWLGIKSLRSIRRDSEMTIPQAKHITSIRAFRVGLVICMTNPKALLFFGSVLTALVPAGAPLWWNISAVVVMVTIGMSLHLTTATLFSRPAVMARYLRARNVISGLFGVIFIGFGGKIALDALRQLRA